MYNVNGENKKLNLKKKIWFLQKFVSYLFLNRYFFEKKKKKKRTKQQQQKAEKNIIHCVFFLT